VLGLETLYRYVSVTIARKKKSCTDFGVYILEEERTSLPYFGVYINLLPNITQRQSSIFMITGELLYGNCLTSSMSLFLARHMQHSCQYHNTNIRRIKKKSLGR